jgi:hypothetical protein
VPELVVSFHKLPNEQRWGTARRKLAELLAGGTPYSGATLLSTNATLFWSQLERHKEDPLIPALASALLTVPTTETCCEHSFSYLRMIRSKHRRQLHLANIERQLYMKLSGLNEQKRNEIDSSTSSEESEEVGSSSASP